MDKSPISALRLHTETRLTLDCSSSIVHIQLPSTSAFSRSNRFIRQVIDLPTSKTEEEYKTRIANSSSIYFRSKKKYPRSIIWRSLEENKVIEIRSLDISKSHGETKEANIPLQFGFPNPIHKDGIAIADSEDEIYLFALDTSNNLYTITLKSSFFCKLSATEDDFERWVKIFQPSSLSISSPYRLTAESHEILISLTDGRLLRLTRQIGDDGTNWVESAYNDGQWGSSLRGLIRWSASNNSVSYEGNTLDYNTALNFKTSPDKAHILTVGLNHTLKFWNIKSGKATVVRDLLDKLRGPNDVQNLIIHPGTQKVLEVFECQSAFDGDLYYALTYSPHSSIFKFWGIRDADVVEFGVRDLFSDDTLRAPEPDDGALWTISDFKIKADHKSPGIDIWILMRLNRRYKLYHRQVSELRSLGSEWNYGWTSIAVDPTKNEPINEPPLKNLALDSTSIGEKWLNYIATPGRFPEATLETALLSYIETRQLPLPNSKVPLKERIANSIASQIYLQDGSTEQQNLEWTSFWNIITEIDQLHWEPLSLGFDQIYDIPYVIFSNGCSIIRDFSEIEKIAYNASVDLAKNQDVSLVQSIEMDNSSVSSNPEELAAIVTAAAKFRSSFSNILKASSQFALQNELWLDSSLSIPERIQSFYDKCDFESEVGDRVYNSIESTLKPWGGFAALRTHLLLSIINTVPNEKLTDAVKISSTLFGEKILVKGVRDLTATQGRVLTDLLYLLVFVAVEADREDFLLDDLDANEVFVQLLELLRQNQMTQWLLDNTKPGKDVSTFEDLFLKDIKLKNTFSQSQSSTITQTIRDALTWACGNNEIPLNEVLVNIQCGFLHKGLIDLASSFSRFQPSTAWSTYIQGRLHLTRHEYNEAAQCFKKAAFKLCK
jgi:nuclear pore complex protein Nup160